MNRRDFAKATAGVAAALLTGEVPKATHKVSELTFSMSADPRELIDEIERRQLAAESVDKVAVFRGGIQDGLVRWTAISFDEQQPGDVCLYIHGWGQQTYIVDCLGDITVDGIPRPAAAVHPVDYHGAIALVQCGVKFEPKT